MARPLSTQTRVLALPPSAPLPKGTLHDPSLSSLPHAADSRRNRSPTSGPDATARPCRRSKHRTAGRHRRAPPMIRPEDASRRMEELCARAPVIPVLVVADAAAARPLAAALVAGGLPVIEVTLRTPAAPAVIAAMTEVPGAIVGAGTVLDAADVRIAKAAGACFAVSPGSTPTLLDACAATGLPLMPGAATASEAMALLGAGHRIQKFFPAMAAGGRAMLRALAGPLPEIGFCPTGGIGAESAGDWLALPNVRCVGGSWVAPPDLIAAGDWSGIEALARAAAGLR